MDDFDADVVRRTVHSFYDKGEYPTALLILNELKKKMPNYEVRSVRRLLKNLNFSFKNVMMVKKCYWNEMILLLYVVNFYVTFVHFDK